jgi:hypothetical protein
MSRVSKKISVLDSIDGCGEVDKKKKEKGKRK